MEFDERNVQVKKLDQNFRICMDFDIEWVSE